MNHWRESAIRRVCIFIIISLTLMACTTQKQSGVVGAAAAPLTDLNLVREKIPEVLVEAQKAPYAVPLDQSCSSLDMSISALDEVLGLDLDAPDSDDPTMIERGSKSAGKAMVGTLRRTLEGVIPFRGWVRKLSGAERYSKQVAQSIASGVVRRSFLKGYRASKECP